MSASAAIERDRFVLLQGLLLQLPVLNLGHCFGLVFREALKFIRLRLREVIVLVKLLVWYNQFAFEIFTSFREKVVNSIGHIVTLTAQIRIFLMLYGCIGHMVTLTAQITILLVFYGCIVPIKLPDTEQQSAIHFCLNLVAFDFLRCFCTGGGIQWHLYKI